MSSLHYMCVRIFVGQKYFVLQTCYHEFDLKALLPILLFLLIWLHTCLSEKLSNSIISLTIEKKIKISLFKEVGGHQITHQIYPKFLDMICQLIFEQENISINFCFYI